MGITAKRAFSLIELSIWITVIAMIMASMLTIIRPPVLDEAEKVDITTRRLDKIEKAIEAFRVKFGRLPCPASPTLADSAAEAYREYCVTTTTAGTPNNGVLPVAALGLQIEDALDGWGRRFTYQVSTQLCGLDSNASTPSGETVNCTPTTYRCGSSLPAACVRDFSAVGTSNIGDLSVYYGSTPTLISSAVAYVLLSHGVDGEGAYMPTGSRRLILSAGSEVGGADNVGEDENFVLTDNIFFTDNIGVTSDTLAFDDLVRFKTKDQIEARVIETARYLMPLNTTTSPARVGCYNASGGVDSVTEAINAFTSTVSTTIDSALAYLPTDSGGSSIAGQHFASILWNMQEICIAYYGASAFTRKCPNGDSPAYSTTKKGCV